MPKKQSLEELFWKYAVKGVKPDDCWGWTGHTHDFGYGLIGKRVDGKKVKFYAHVVSYQMHVGEVPKGVTLLHSCDNPPCSNFTHLTPGTQTENMHDMWNKGRGCTANHFKPKLTEAEVDQINALISFGFTQGKIAAAFDISQAAVSLINQGQR